MHRFFIFCCFLQVSSSYVIFNGTVRAQIINLHNTFRSNLAFGKQVWIGKSKNYPNASRMFWLKWDDALATSAGKRAASKVIQNNEGKLTAAIPAGVGENHYGVEFASVGTNLPPTSMFQKAWQDWNSYWMIFGLPSLTYTPSTDPINDHDKESSYQLFTGNTYAVGCAYQIVTPNLGGYVVVCHYRNKGLNANTPVYVVGTTCSQCPAATSTCNAVKGLCVMN
ncbi:unnamed protein product, partial [Mesorhabditis belari]|uniref:SCP domain-containing protein n=1 Tax=Mesorhabditis belari TaxID=2138241 RepID=A0AAF3FR33_9BILA